MNKTIDNLNKLRLQLIGVANQSGNTDCAVLAQDLTKEITRLQTYWNEIKGQDVIFKHLLNCKEFDSELTEYFSEAIMEDRAEFDYEYEGVSFRFYDIYGYVEVESGDYETPPSIDAVVSEYLVEAFFYNDEGDFENIPVEGALLELVKLKLNFDE